MWNIILFSWHFCCISLAVRLQTKQSCYNLSYTCFFALIWRVKDSGSGRSQENVFFLHSFQMSSQFYSKMQSEHIGKIYLVTLSWQGVTACLCGLHLLMWSAVSVAIPSTEPDPTATLARFSLQSESSNVFFKKAHSMCSRRCRCSSTDFLHSAC